MLQLVLAHDKTKKAHYISKKSYKFKQELNIHQNEENDTNNSAMQARDIKKTAKKEGLKQMKQNWENKPLHGKYLLRSQKADVDQGNTHHWLRSAGLKAEIEGFIMAPQDQILFTRRYQAKIIKNRAHPKCWFFEKFEETVDHLVSGCPIMNPNEYLQRHGRVRQYIHWKICQHYNAPYAKNWYEQKPQIVVETESATILWDIHTDRTKQANKSYITIKDHKEKTWKVI